MSHDSDSDRFFTSSLKSVSYSFVFFSFIFYANMTIVRFIILRGLLKIQIKNAYVEKLNKIVLICCLPLISQNTKMSLLCICVSYIFITNSWFSHIIFIWHLTISSR